MKKFATILAVIAMLAGAGCTQNAQKKSVATTTKTTLSPEQIKENMDTVYHFLKDCGTYYIATVEGDQPRVRPFGTINIFDGKLYIQTGHIKNVAKQIAANPKVELCAFNGNEWIRLSGTLVDDDRVEAKKAMLDAYPSLRGMYDENDDNTAVFYFKDATARICSFVNPEKVIEF